MEPTAEGTKYCIHIVDTAAVLILFCVLQYFVDNLESNAISKECQAILYINHGTVEDFAQIPSQFHVRALCRRKLTQIQAVKWIKHMYTKETAQMIWVLFR